MAAEMAPVLEPVVEAAVRSVRMVITVSGNQRAIRALRGVEAMMKGQGSRCQFVITNEMTALMKLSFMGLQDVVALWDQSGPRAMRYVMIGRYAHLEVPLWANGAQWGVGIRPGALNNLDEVVRQLQVDLFERYHDRLADNQLPWGPLSQRRSLAIKYWRMIKRRDKVDNL